MDMNTLRSIATVLVAISFVVVCWWAFAPSRRKKFDDAAKLPFLDEPKEQGEGEQQTSSPADDIKN